MAVSTRDLTAYFYVNLISTIRGFVCYLLILYKLKTFPWITKETPALPI
jgi:hypothetical protein